MVLKQKRKLTGIRPVGIEVLEGLRVDVDEVEMILQPPHLTSVPGRFQFAQTGNLVDQLLLLADPQGTKKKEEISHDDILQLLLA